MIWVLIALMLLATVITIAVPVFRARATKATTSEYDLAVFIDQMSELERDRQRGLIGDAEFESARAEVGRRVLTAKRAQETESATGGKTGRRNLAAALVVLVVVPAIAGPLYVWRGNPQVSDAAAAVRGVGAQPAADPEQLAGLRDSIDRLRARLDADPEDFDGWVLLGRSYMVTQQRLRALEAYQHAIALRPDEASVQSFLGEATVFSADGVVTENARVAFEQAIQGDGSDPAARFYLALADAQAGNVQAALEAWLRLARDTPPDAPWFPVLQQHLESAARDLDVDLASLLQQQPRAPVAAEEPPSRPGPSRADIDAARDMSPQNRQEMIRGMVARLEERLEENPDDAEGWERLARSHRVLGETDKAEQAAARAQQARGRPQQAPAASGNRPAAPSNDDGQREMIEGMVAGLAARLADDPNDREGWLRLTRSYQVLGRADQALAAFEAAQGAFPDDAELLQLHARAVIEQSAPDAPLATRAFNLYRRVLEVQRGNPEALYFLAHGEAERGNPEEARRLWTLLRDALEQGPEARNVVEDRLRSLGTP